MNLTSYLFAYNKKLLPLLSHPEASFLVYQRCVSIKHKYSVIAYQKGCNDQIHNGFNNSHKMNAMISPMKPFNRGYRFRSRRPIQVIRHDIKGKSFDDYLEHSKLQEGKIIDENYMHQENPSDIPKENHRDFPREKPLPPKNLKEERSQTSKKSNHAPTVEKKDMSSMETEDESDSDDDLDNNGKRILKNLNSNIYRTAPRKIKDLLSFGKSSRLRRKNDVFVVEGWRLLAEALMCGLKPMAIFYSRSRLFLNMVPQVTDTEEDLVSLLNLYPLYKTRYDTFKLWSSLTTSPGIMAAFSLSTAAYLSATAKKYSLPVTVILDEVRDPNNMGSILRTITAVGVEKVVMIKGCCDIWDPKVLRSSCGANFHTYCVSNVLWSSIETELPSSHNLFIADVSRDTSTTDSTEQAESMDPLDVESLRESSISESESRRTYEKDEMGNVIIKNDTFQDIYHLEQFETVQLPKFSYTHKNVSFFAPNGQKNQPVVLIIGGEVGLTNTAKKFALENDGLQLNIPMIKGVDSLNCGVATGILVYEMLRQFNDCGDEKHVSEESTEAVL